MKKIFLVMILFGILIVGFISPVIAKPEVQEWCFTYYNGYSICGERKININEVTDGSGQIHYNYKDLTKIKFYDPSGEQCGREQYTVQHNYLVDSDLSFVTRIHRYYTSQYIDFENCTFNFEKLIRKYNSDGLQFCKGVAC